MIIMNDLTSNKSWIFFNVSCWFSSLSDLSMFCLFNRKLQKLVPSQNLSQLKLENHMFSQNRKKCQFANYTCDSHGNCSCHTVIFCLTLKPILFCTRGGITCTLSLSFVWCHESLHPWTSLSLIMLQEWKCKNKMACISSSCKKARKHFTLLN